MLKGKIIFVLYDKLIFKEINNEDLGLAPSPFFRRTYRIIDQLVLDSGVGGLTVVRELMRRFHMRSNL